jgi:flagellar basal-body rod protein FlgB
VIVHYDENRKFRKSAMAPHIDTGLEFYRQVLALRGYRQEILSADIANASTPKFKAVDLDFREALRTVISGDASSGASRLPGPPWLIEDPRHQMAASNALPAAVAASVKYQTGTAVTLDGNSVDLNREKTAAAENAVQYEAVAAFTSQTIRMLTVAISGTGPQQTGGA